MQGEFKVQFYCPPMAIKTVGRGLRRTAEEPMIFTAFLPQGELVIKPVTLPETDVHVVHWPLRWMVDACAAEAGDEQSNYVTVRYGYRRGYDAVPRRWRGRTW